MNIVRGQEVKVLDHGYVKLVDWMGSDEDVVIAARQSTGRGFEGWGPDKICRNCRIRYANSVGICAEVPGEHDWIETKGDLKLLETLWSNGHSTPFEMASLKFQVQAPIMVFREWHRHRTLSYSELSARYIQMPNLHYVPNPERVKGQSKSNKQGSEGALDPVIVSAFIRHMQEEQTSIYETYDDYLKDGVSRELARLNTPVSRYSRMQVSGNLLNWFRFLGLRLPTSAQEEIRSYANVIADMISQLFPRSSELFLEHTLHAKKLSRTQVSIFKELVLALRQEEGISVSKNVEIADALASLIK